MTGGQARNFLTFAEVLKGAGGSPALTFTFKKGATSCSSQATATPDSNGAFSVDLPMDQCPAGLFDGADVTVDVSAAGQVLATGQPVNLVPYARYAERVGTPDCPVGYERDAGQAPVVCQKKVNGQVVDEIVKVGSGPGAFWIDRYEASVWSIQDANGVQFDGTTVPYPVQFPQNGQWSGTTPPAYAMSRAGVMPSVNLTWFQAMEACAASGKRLPGRQEWMLAVRGTVDPGANPGTAGACVTSAGGPRATGNGKGNCESAWGAQDMIGNVLEWMDEWYAGAGAWIFDPADSMNSMKDHGRSAGAQMSWPEGYSPHNHDYTSNITTHVNYYGVNEIDGMPAAALRGGDWGHGDRDGIFALNLEFGPSSRQTNIGFRCAIRR